MSDAVSDALSTFGSNSSRASASKLDAKRKGAARDRALAKAPANVRQKWNDICNLKGRDRSKNIQKHKFTELLLADTKFEDSYWSTEVSDDYSRMQKHSGKWVMRAVADTLHGTGDIGHRIVQDAINCGWYISRKNKCKGPDGNMHEIEEVRMREEVQEDTHTQSLKCKARAGGASNKDEIGAAIANTIQAFDIQEQEDATAPPTQEATQEGKMENKTATKKKPTPRKRPAAAEPKKPAEPKKAASQKRSKTKQTKETDTDTTQIDTTTHADASYTPEESQPLGAEALERMNAENEKKNEHINAAVRKGLQMLNKALLEVMSAESAAAFVTPESTSKQRHKDLLLDELAEVRVNINEMNGRLMQASINQQSLKYMDTKATLLNSAANILNEAKSVIKDMKAMFPQCAPHKQCKSSRSSIE